MFTFIHISDLHIGKRLHNYDLLPDQRYIFKQIVSIVEEKRPDALFIAGDVYDKTNPTEEAVSLLDELLEALNKTGTEIFMIPGNHDPAEKLSYLSSIVDRMGVHIAKPYSGTLEKRSLKGVDIYMLPYVNLANGKRFFPDKEISSLEDVVRETIDASKVDGGRINILLAHQFVSGATKAGSEQIIGGELPISASILYPFNYVALGHIHRAQTLGVSTIRYSGSPLKYSAKERDSKALVYGEVSQEGEVSVSLAPLKPLRDIAILKGPFDEVMANDSPNDYVYAVLTDETDIPDASPRLASKFKYFLALDYDNSRTRGECEDYTLSDIEEEKRPHEYFSELFTMLTGRKLSEDQEAVLNEAIEEIWGNA